MKAVYTIVGLVSMIGLPIGFICVLCYDLAHPELWDQDWMHDPRGYLTFIAVVFPSLLFWWWCELRKPERMREEIRQRRSVDGQPGE